MSEYEFSLNRTLRKKCPNTEFFWSAFSCIWTEYGPEKTPYLDTFQAVVFSRIRTESKILSKILSEKTHILAYFLHTEFYAANGQRN